MPRIKTPFVGDSFDPMPGARRMGDLLRYGADRSADYEMERGRIAANLGSNLANIVGQTVGGIAQHYADEKKAQPARDAMARENAVNDVKRMVPVDETTGRPNFAQIAKEVASIDLDAAVKYFQAADAETQQKLAIEGERVYKVGALLEQFHAETKKLAPPAKQEAWTAYRADAIASGIASAEDVPEQFNPRFLSQLRATNDKLMSLFEKLNPPEAAPKTREIKTRNADGSESIQIVEDMPGQSFTSAAVPKETKRHMVTVAGPDGRPMQRLATEEELAAGVPTYREPKVAPQPNYVQVVGADGTLRMMTAEEIRAQGGVPTGKAPSTAKPNAAIPVLDEIETLSKRINTGGMGPLSNLAGASRRAAAAGNMDNDVSEYQSLVEGFIPMVARAVGHTGVLTQQDVDSVRALFPKPGDNAQLAQNKMARVRKLIGAMNPDGTNAITNRPPVDAVSPPAPKVNPFRKK